MLRGIGVDILNISRLQGFDGDWDDPFFTKAFTAAERRAALGRREPLLFFAERFAAKEAVFKALGLPRDAVSLAEIETLSDEAGRPRVTLYGATLAAFTRAGGGAVSVSLSNDEGLVCAFAVCESV